MKYIVVIQLKDTAMSVTTVRLQADVEQKRWKQTLEAMEAVLKVRKLMPGRLSAFHSPVATTWKADDAVDVDEIGPKR